MRLELKRYRGRVLIALACALPGPAVADLRRAERELDTALAEGRAMGMSRLIADAAGLRRALDLVHGRPDRV